MKITKSQLVIAVATGVALVGISGTALAATTNPNRLTNLKTRGDTEITRRLTTLGTLSAKISATAKVSASDKSYLTTEVTTETAGLTALKAKLDSETDITAARTDVQSIFTEYRVYALVVPKVHLVAAADRQQTNEDKLTTLRDKLQVRISADQSAGKDVSTLSAKLADMTTQITNARAISSAMEQKVLTLQPADYNANHALLTGDLAQLKQAHSDNAAALADAKAIAQGLKALK